jgi:dolichol-phosphate mannosyltransferase
MGCGLPPRPRGARAKLSVIVPTYNERENIAELIERIEGALREIPFELVIVDDNSPDGTSELATRSGMRYGNVRVMRRAGRLGLGSAVAYGLEMADGEVIAVMDADLQHPPELLPLMYQWVERGNSLVVASRYVRGGRATGLSTFRRFVSSCAVKLSHLLLPKVRGIKDPVSGFFMLRREVVDRVKLNPTGFKVLLEILVEGKYGSVMELPYTFESREKGRSKLDLREVLRYIMLLLDLRFRQRPAGTTQE